MCTRLQYWSVLEIHKLKPEHLWQKGLANKDGTPFPPDKTRSEGEFW